MSTKTLLHVGCGSESIKSLKGFDNEWLETRVDLDPKHKPDIIGSASNLSMIPDNSVDAVYNSHCIEHLPAHEVGRALKDFYRVLNSDGFLIITCPDLIAACSAALQQGLTETLYVSPAGPIAAIDIIYGHRMSVYKHGEYMCHRIGFSSDILKNELETAGFTKIIGGSRKEYYDIWYLATKSDTSDSRLVELANQFLP